MIADQQAARLPRPLSPFTFFGPYAQYPLSLTDHEDPRTARHRSKDSRFYRHVVHSESSKKFLASVIKTKRRSAVLAAIFGAVSIVCASGGLAGVPSAAVSSRSRAAVGALAACLGTLALSAGMGKLERHFYVNFERHPFLP